jgi:hypothetical protein
MTHATRVALTEFMQSAERIYANRDNGYLETRALALLLARTIDALLRDGPAEPAA